MAFWIVTDACCDLPTSYIRQQKDFIVVPMAYQIGGEEKLHDLTRDDCAQTTQQFYDRLEQGETSTTSQINQLTWMEQLEPLCKRGDDVLVLAFSSGLSGTCQAAMLAGQDLRRKYPDRKIFVLDSLCASMGEGLAVHYALQYRDAGHDAEETAVYMQQQRMRCCHWFTVNDLHFLRRGGRVKATSAYLGSMLKIKPILNVDPKGHLIPRQKVQGRKHSLRSLFEKAQELADHPEQQTMFISHSACEKDAQALADKLQSEQHVPHVLLSTISPIIGTHTGPGTVALFFVDKNGEGRMDAPEED
ncbi:MAG: DegV family protein [Eubacteriales bacterium]|nr:DegV family protein [Eubacteriales bacterium]